MCLSLGIIELSAVKRDLSFLFYIVATKQHGGKLTWLANKPSTTWRRMSCFTDEKIRAQDKGLFFPPEFKPFQKVKVGIIFAELLSSYYLTINSNGLFL